MIDVTRQKEKRPFLWKEYATNILIANIPASILWALLKEAGVTGVMPIMILLFGGAYIVGETRSKKGKVATGKSVLYALGLNVVIFIIIPVIFFAISE